MVRLRKAAVLLKSRSDMAAGATLLLKGLGQSEVPVRGTPEVGDPHIIKINLLEQMFPKKQALSLNNLFELRFK